MTATEATDMWVRYCDESMEAASCWARAYRHQAAADRSNPTMDAADRASAAARSEGLADSYSGQARSWGESAASARKRRVDDVRHDELMAELDRDRPQVET